MDPREAPEELDAYARDSARLSQTLAILRKVADGQEKALIFVEDLAMQDRLAGLIQQHFKLPSRPTRINGGVPGHMRQGLVEKFQSNPGTFDVMILTVTSTSPKEHPEVAAEHVPSAPEPVTVQTGRGGQPEPSEAEPARPILSLPKVAEAAQVRIWRRSAGEPRPTDEILSLFEGKHVAQISIRDPYALGTYESRKSQIQFLRDLQERTSALESVLIEYAPEIEGDLEELACRREFGSDFATEFTGSLPRLVLARRSKRTRDDDFHDRFIEIDVKHTGGALKRHELTIGRGLEALYNPRRQCTVTYAPPGG